MKNIDLIISTLKKAANTFVKEVDGTIQIWASSMDWFQQEWGRDTFISLPGLLLSTHRFEEAKNNIKNFARYEKNGLIPNRIADPKKPETIEYNTVDGSMWFVQAVKKYLDCTGDWKFVEEISPVVRDILQGYEKGTSFERLNKRHEIRMDKDGLIISPAQSTWMDADPDGRGMPITPRNGKTVEVNALWYSNLKFVAALESREASSARAKRLKELAALVKKSFNGKFWNESQDCLYDVIEGDPHKDAIRPNMIFAVSHGEDLLSNECQKKVFDVVTRDLLTPYGLRTLSPKDAKYHGKFYTERPPIEKDFAYHQGTVWPWLIGPYIDALVRLRKSEKKSLRQIQSEITAILTPLCDFMMAYEYKTIPEVYDGDAPHRPGGTRSQAWSVAEVLRTITEYLKPGN